MDDVNNLTNSGSDNSGSDNNSDLLKDIISALSRLENYKDRDIIIKVRIAQNVLSIHTALNEYKRYNVLDMFTRVRVCEKIIQAIYEVKYEKQSHIYAYDDRSNELDDINCNYIYKLCISVNEEFANNLFNNINMPHNLKDIIKDLHKPTGVVKEELDRYNQKIQENIIKPNVSYDHPCRNCGARLTEVRAKMTRSLDEGMGGSYKCIKCRATW